MKDTYKIHTGYIIVILLVTIIVLITVRWSAVPDLVGYLNFAATLASLLLAVVAITYAMYSNSSISQTVGELNRASTEIRIAAVGIEKTNSELHQRVIEIPPKIENVSNSMDEIKADIRERFPDNETLARLLRRDDGKMATPESMGKCSDECASAMTANLKEQEARYLLRIDNDVKYLMELTSLYKEMVGPEYEHFHDDFHWGQMAAVERWLVLMRLLRGIILTVDEVEPGKMQVKLNPAAKEMMETKLGLR